MPDLVVSRSNGTWFFRLSRPTKCNALSAEVVAALNSGLDEFEAAKARVLVLEGEGRHFCAGFDLAEVEKETDASLLYRFVAIEQLLARLWKADYPTVAVATGRVVGAGADLFVSCAHRIAVRGSRFAFPGAGFGIALGTRRLSRRVGESNALNLIQTGRAIDCDEALSCGLATSLVTASELDDHLAAEIAGATRLDRTTYAAVRAAARAETFETDQDLANLVRSAARPGLRDNILAFRNHVLGSRLHHASGSSD